MMEHLNDVERGKTIHVNGILYRVGNKAGEMTEVQNKETKELKAWPSRMMVEVVHNVPQEEESDFPSNLTLEGDSVKATLQHEGKTYTATVVKFDEPDSEGNVFQKGCFDQAIKSGQMVVEHTHIPKRTNVV